MRGEKNGLHTDKNSSNGKPSGSHSDGCSPHRLGDDSRREHTGQHQGWCANCIRLPRVVSPYVDDQTILVIADP